MVKIAKRLSLCESKICRAEIQEIYRRQIRSTQVEGGVTMLRASASYFQRGCSPLLPFWPAPLPSWPAPRPALLIPESNRFTILISQSPSHSFSLSFIGCQLCIISNIYSLFDVCIFVPVSYADKASIMCYQGKCSNLIVLALLTNQYQRSIITLIDTVVFAVILKQDHCEFIKVESLLLSTQFMSLIR